MKLRSIKGMNDCVPPDTLRWQHIESTLSAILRRYGYHEIRLPIMEYTAVFQRSIGDITDIVQKEMYSFDDRNGDNLSLRPEGTAGCVRALLEHDLVHRQQRKLWYSGPMFRHERPQRGRYRQFHQLGVEVFDYPGPDIDAELIIMTARMWAELALNGLELQINSLGKIDSRREYSGALVRYFSQYRDSLDADSLTRLDRNPIRILDSKNPALREIIANAPQFDQYLDADSRKHFDELCELLTTAGIAFQINPHLVRGLDYYSNTVFEWVTTELGAQGTVCAGGRYDDLVELLGGKPTPAIGFAMGLERLIELTASAVDCEAAAAADVYIVISDQRYTAEGLLLAESVRDRNPRWRVVCHCGGGSIKSQMKRANRVGAQVALIIGEQEHSDGTVTVKPLREQAAQTTVPRERGATEIIALVA